MFTKAFTIYYIIIALINSIGRKWDDELRKIWEEGFISWSHYAIIPVILDIITYVIRIIMIKK